MNIKRCAISFALLAVLLGGLALPASAQSYKGKFTLPFEAVWGPAVLEPGEYTVWTDALVSTSAIHIEGNGKTATVLVGVADVMEPSSQKGRLEITDVNGTHVVTKLTAAAAGREYFFGVPKAVKQEGLGIAIMKKAAIPVSDSR
jgi:hypothetical protein